MQPSIKSFFRTRQQTAASQAQAKDGDDANENDGHKKDDAAALKSLDVSEKCGQLKTPNKRPVISDDEDDAAAPGDDIRSVATKRQAIVKSSDATTPVKSDKQIIDPGDSNKTTLSTPAKQVFGQSPLLSVEALIRKKISTGSYALHENIGSTWFKALQGEFDKPYFKKLSTFIQQQRQSKTVYPPEAQVYTWTHYHTIRDTRVVVIGQDPYHGPGQAHGLSFSVQEGVAVPRSLQNIYKELENDIPNFKTPLHGNLTGWSKQGVLMLNACLTVNRSEPNSHQGKGWENLTDAVISWLNKNVSHNVVFILWGKFAQKKSTLITNKRHKILTSAHPSPYSADSGFFGCKHFSQTNEYLRSQRLPVIDWSAL